MTQIISSWTLEVLQPGQNSEVRTHCASIRITNTSAGKVLTISPRSSSYQLPIAPGASWGIDLADVRDELATIIDVYTSVHDAQVIVERIFKRSA